MSSEEHVPFTSRLLIGINETHTKKVENFVVATKLSPMMWTHPKIRNTNFQTKKGTLMKNVSKPSFENVEWTIAITC
jgi:FO synthase